MANIQPSKRDGEAASISAHRLFPAVIALWFAALFGLGCAVLPAFLFEQAASASGIAALIPAAAPPLGSTARILISLAAAVFGAGLGLVIARRVAAAQAARRPARAGRLAKISGLQPIAAKAELGSDGLDALAPEKPCEPELEAVEPAPEDGWEPESAWAPEASREEQAEEETRAQPQVPFPEEESVRRAEASLDGLGLAALTERLGRSLRDPRPLPPPPPDLLVRLKAALAQLEVPARPADLALSGEEKSRRETGGSDALTGTTAPLADLGSFRDYARDYIGGDDGEEDEEEDEASDGASFGSLLGMKLRKKDPNAVSPLDGLPPEALEMEARVFDTREGDRSLLAGSHGPVL